MQEELKLVAGMKPCAEIVWSLSFFTFCFARYFKINKLREKWAKNEVFEK
jgi:hypothetical protein